MHELGFDLSYGWDAYHALKAVWKGGPASAFVARELEELRTPAAGRRLRFTTNHDETAWDAPPVTLFGGGAGARAAFLAMALLPGAPLLYNGQEVESPQKLGLFEKETVAWEQPRADEARRFYRQVLELARTHPAFVEGDLVRVETDAPQDVIAYARDNVVVLVNPRARPVSFAVQRVPLELARVLLSSAPRRGPAITLPPHGYLLLELPPRRR